MYLTHFGLKKNPFALAPDPKFYFDTEAHRVAMAVLEYSVLKANDFCLLTGQVGCGKTTLVRLLVERISGRSEVGVVYQTHHAFGDLMDWVFDAFDLELPAESSMRIRQFRRYLDGFVDHPAPPVLIFDEAQNLSREDLDAVRVLSNLNADGKQRIQLILVGQPEIRNTLRQPDMRQLVQRIAVDCDLRALTLEELSAYITHRLELAGCHRKLFTDEAVVAIHQYGRGVPRVSNALCDLSLLFAQTDGAQTVCREVVDEVVKQKCAEGLYWIPDPASQVVPIPRHHKAQAQIPAPE